jgi:hypothetical protein
LEAEAKRRAEEEEDQRRAEAEARQRAEEERSRQEAEATLHEPLACPEEPKPRAESRTPLVLASVFALASLPVEFAMAFLFDGNNWSWFSPGKRGAGDSGVLAGGMLVVGSALALVRRRGAEIKGTEVAFYWLGSSLAVTAAMVALFSGINWGWGPWGFLAGGMLAAISGVILHALWHRRAAA